MGEKNIESANDETMSGSTPVWVGIIKWFLVVINCMWIFADSIGIIMGAKVVHRPEALPDSDTKIRALATIELIICLIGLIGLIGHKFFIIVFHLIAIGLYLIILFALNQCCKFDDQMFWVESVWIMVTAFYAYQIRIRSNRPVFDTTTTS